MLLWLSLASALMGQDLRIAHIANAGVMVSCGEESALVDALFREGVEGYETHLPEQREQLETARAPYDRVRVILATHRHRDHFDAQAVARHLKQNGKALFAGTAQTAGEVRKAGGERSEVVTWGSDRQWGTLRVSFLKLPHNPPHRDTIENTAIVLRWCGKTLLFTGDADMRNDEFEALRLDRSPVDTLMAPWWFLTSARGREIVDRIVKPKQVWALHGDLENSQRWQTQVRANYPSASIGFRGK
ncbi:MAG: MBL fold metallo-hydrolase [Bryobacterales bacterium]|nr:MBL fold metallo-hydrolase [Bryobacterales bacterium]